jgi:hypothetical protein
LNSDEYILAALVVMNLAAGFGCAVPIARGLGKVTGRPEKFFRYFALLIAIYFVECVAFPMGMMTQVFSVGLAFVWGIIFSLWLRYRGPRRAILKLALSLAFYGSLPTASFCILIPVIGLLSGRHILSAEEGVGFGIPDFFPWPLNTMLGFSTAILIGTVVFKALITTGIANRLIGGAEKASVDSFPEKKGYIKK